jgi:hypothetical protein
MKASATVRKMPFAVLIPALSGTAVFSQSLPDESFEAQNRFLFGVRQKPTAGPFSGSPRSRPPGSGRLARSLTADGRSASKKADGSSGLMSRGVSRTVRDPRLLQRGSRDTTILMLIGLNRHGMSCSGEGVPEGHAQKRLGEDTRH